MIRGWLLLLLAIQPTGAVRAEIVTRLPGEQRRVALTFDACESRQHTILDAGVVAELRRENVPFTVFMGGLFAKHHAAEVRELAQDTRVDIENHSYSHPRDMRRLTDQAVRDEVTRATSEIRDITGRTTRYFRFPGGNADTRTVALVEGLGYKVVHWRFPSGDPDPRLSAASILTDTLARVHAGDILIFHINGRGVHTAQVIGPLVDELRARKFTFVRIDEALAP